MEYGICHLSAIPVRIEPSDKSEMVTQLLFGESLEVLGREKQWVRIKCLHDNYEGWVDTKQFLPLEKKNVPTKNAKHSVAIDLVKPASHNNTQTPVLIGSTLPQFDGMNFKIGKQKYIYNGQAVDPQQSNLDTGFMVKCAKIYLNAPYLWGGRSPFGIDCSGYVQVLYKIMGIPIPRDAYQQAEKGKLISFINEVQPGDLAFFDNDEGAIIHVGLIINQEEILHAAGKVRLDKIDHYGIYNRDISKYTHKLRIIKRLL